MNKRAKSNSIRIIAGQWRGRRLPVLDQPGLRPTTDRVRETLFNWLMHEVGGANCLDLFAGSGALGFECLSRGAEFVQFVESKRAVVDALMSNLHTLGVDDDRAAIEPGNALQFLSQSAVQSFDLVFLDPPFAAECLAEVISLLIDNAWLNKNGLVYVEQHTKAPALSLPPNWKVFREGSAGQSRYALLSID